MPQAMVAVEVGGKADLRCLEGRLGGTWRQLGPGSDSSRPDPAWPASGNGGPLASGTGEERSGLWPLASGSGGAARLLLPSKLSVTQAQSSQAGTRGPRITAQGRPAKKKNKRRR